MPASTPADSSTATAPTPINSPRTRASVVLNVGDRFAADNECDALRGCSPGR